MKLRPDVIFVCNTIISSREKALDKPEMLSLINQILEEWKIPPSRALDCIDEYVEHLNGIMKEYESMLGVNSADRMYNRYKV